MSEDKTFWIHCPIDQLGTWTKDKPEFQDHMEQYYVEVIEKKAFDRVSFAYELLDKTCQDGINIAKELAIIIKSTQEKYKKAVDLLKSIRSHQVRGQIIDWAQWDEDLNKIDELLGELE